LGKNIYKILSFPTPFAAPPFVSAQSSKEALWVYAENCGVWNDPGWQIEPFEQDWALVLRDDNGTEFVSIYAAICV